MKVGEYVGPRVELKGKTARLRTHLEGGVVAQFEDSVLPDESGWHRFAASDFKIVRDNSSPCFKYLEGEQ